MQVTVPKFYFTFSLSIDKDLKVDGCPSRENLLGQSALLINATYNVLP